MSAFKIGDWVYTNQFNIVGYKPGVYKIIKVEQYDDYLAIAVEIDERDYIWCYPPHGSITRLAYPYEIPGRPTISKKQKEHLLNLISSI